MKKIVLVSLFYAVLNTGCMQISDHYRMLDQPKFQDALTPTERQLFAVDKGAYLDDNPKTKPYLFTMEWEDIMNKRIDLQNQISSLRKEGDTDGADRKHRQLQLILKKAELAAQEQKRLRGLKN